MFTVIRRRLTFWVVTAAAGVAFLCCGCSDTGVGGAFVIARNGGNNECGKDGTAGSCKTVTIGGKKWMAENLNYKPSSGNSWCLDDKESNCNIYGRLYTWEAAKAACPRGWHLPSKEEWAALVDAAGGSSVAGKRLKSTYGWYDGGNETDSYGFSALPGGYRYSDGRFDDAGSGGFWWTATEYDAYNAYSRGMYYDYDHVSEGYSSKGNAFSARCVEDERQ